MENLQELRDEIEVLDDQLIKIFSERLKIAEKVAKYKKQHGLSIFQPDREIEIIKKVCGKVPGQYAEYLSRLYQCIFEISRDMQEEIIKDKNPTE